MQFIDDNYSCLGCCRKDKKCNVYLLALFKHFFVLKETWSNWLTFRTYSTGIIPPETNGQAVTNIKIKYTDNSGTARQFNFSPVYPIGSYERKTTNKQYDVRMPVFSLRAGFYTAVLTISIFNELNSYDKPFSKKYEETIPFVVNESGNVVLGAFAKLGAKYKKFQKLKYDLNYKTEVEFEEDQFSHYGLQLTTAEARDYYKWFDLESNIIYNVPEGTPWGFSPTKETTTKTKVATSTTSKTSTAKNTKTTLNTTVIPKPTATKTKTHVATAKPKPATNTRVSPPTTKPSATISKPAQPSKPIKPAVPIPSPTSILTSKPLELKKTDFGKLELKKRF